MGMVMGVTAVILGLAAALVGVILGTALIFPRPADRARRVLEERPGRCFLTGCVLALLLGVPARALLQDAHGLAKAAGWVLAFPHLAVLVALGMTGMAQLLGERLRALSPTVTPLAGLVRGAVILELVLALPFFGWFLFAPILGLTLLGAGALSIVAGVRNRRKSVSQIESENAYRGGHSSTSLEPVQGGEATAPVVPEVWRLTPDASPGGAAR